MAAEETSLDDLLWLSQTDTTRDHTENDHDARETADRALKTGTSEELSRALCRKVIVAAQAGTMTYSEAQRDLEYAMLQIQQSGMISSHIKVLGAVAAARFAGTEYVRGHWNLHMASWATWYYEQAVHNRPNHPEGQNTPDPLRTALEIHMGLLALQARNPKQAKQFHEQANEYARATQSELGTGSVEYNKLVEEQLDRARQLLALVNSYPTRNSEIGDTNQVWNQIMLHLLGNPDIPEETNRQS